MQRGRGERGRHRPVLLSLRQWLLVLLRSCPDGDRRNLWTNLCTRTDLTGLDRARPRRRRLRPRTARIETCGEVAKLQITSSAIASDVRLQVDQPPGDSISSVTRANASGAN